MKKDCEEELSKLNQLMDKLNPPAEADFIKRLVDEVVSVKFKQANKLKKHWKRNFKLNTGTTNDYTSFDNVKSIQSFVLLPNTWNWNLFLKPQIYPEITAVQYRKDDVVKMFSNTFISPSDTKPNKRRMKQIKMKLSLHN